MKSLPDNLIFKKISTLYQSKNYFMHALYKYSTKVYTHSFRQSLVER